jgi:hypothetical protein
MSTFELSPETIPDPRPTRKAVRRRSRSAAMRHLANALVVLGLGIAIGLLTATYEIDRQDRAARVAR